MNRQTRKQLRRRLFDADPHCRYCRTPVTFRRSSLDHAIPQQHGGTDDESSLVLCCRDCNSRKGGFLPAELFQWASRVVAAANQ